MNYPRPEVHDARRITIDSDMEDSDGAESIPSQMGQEVVLEEEDYFEFGFNPFRNKEKFSGQDHVLPEEEDDFVLGFSTVRAKGKTYKSLVYPNEQGLVTPPREQHPQKRKYHSSPSPTEPSFMSDEEAFGPFKSSKRPKRVFIWLAVLIFLVLVIIVPVAVVLNKNNAEKRSVALDQNGDGDVDGSQGGSDTPGGDNDGDEDGDDHTTVTGESKLLKIIESVTPAEMLADPTTPQAKAAQWLLDDEDSYDYDDNDEFRLQRYALAVVGHSVYPSGVDVPLFGRSQQNHCRWRGITCSDTTPKALTGSTNFWLINTFKNNTRNRSGLVTQISWPERSLSGTIPTEIALLSSLKILDFGDNELTGTLPEELFDLENLEQLYLQGNQLEGTLPDSFSKLRRLVCFYGGENQFTGSIPRGLGSRSTGTSNARPLRYLSLERNQLVGTIPELLNLRQVTYLDLSFNQLTGPIPLDWADGGQNQLHRLRHLYLDHNQLSGTIPTTTPALGGGRLQSLFLNDNQFTGTFPGGFTSVDFLTQLEIQNNLLTGFDPYVCYQIVFLGGEVVNFKVDCEICPCPYMCETCW